jgi:hypothetical protein
MSSAPLIPTANMTFTQWWSQLNSDLIGKAVLPVVVDESKWMDLVDQLTQNTRLGTIPSASVEFYPGPDGWRKWAMAFISNLPNN